MALFHEREFTIAYIRLADDERLELLLVGASFGGNLEQAGSSSSCQAGRSKLKEMLGSKLLKPPPISFSAGADLIKVTSQYRR